MPPSRNLNVGPNPRHSGYFHAMGYDRPDVQSGPINVPGPFDTKNPAREETKCHTALDRLNTPANTGKGKHDTADREFSWAVSPAGYTQSPEPLLSQNYAAENRTSTQRSPLLNADVGAIP
ncbi:hypothetical protein ABVK25_011794 [Lepraria finkii]|uniref:Uncharacterized protein n=1 Tax=Lepraria finkii TaxID=1340010 RepID=A0ABR4AL79_9LECA